MVSRHIFAGLYATGLGRRRRFETNFFNWVKAALQKLDWSQELDQSPFKGSPSLVRIR